MDATVITSPVARSSTSAIASVPGRLARRDVDEGATPARPFERGGGRRQAPPPRWPEIRRIIYTTNAIESLNSSLRKLVFHRGHFPSDEAAIKLLFLGLRNLEKRWNRSAREWNKALGQFAIFFEGRLPSGAWRTRGATASLVAAAGACCGCRRSSWRKTSGKPSRAFAWRSRGDEGWRSPPVRRRFASVATPLDRAFRCFARWHAAR